MIWFHKFGGHARGADGAGVPAPGGLLAVALAIVLAASASFLTPRSLVEGALAVGGDQLLAGLDQRGQRGFRIAGDGQIDFVVASEILIVALAEQIAWRKS